MHDLRVRIPSVGDEEGTEVGAAVGLTLGTVEGDFVGLSVGEDDGVYFSSSASMRLQNKGKETGLSPDRSI